jgi:putative transcriptional regulator
MIVFNRLWEKLKERNISTYTLREKCGIDSKTIRRLKANENIETKTIDKLCKVLNCNIEEIAEFIPDEEI